MKQGENSQYAPFINYLKDQPYGQLPATWSRPGKEMLRAVLFKNSSHVVDNLDLNYKTSGVNRYRHEACISGRSKETLLEEHAVALVTSRSWDTAMIPLWDLFNHNNGNINVETPRSVFEGDAMEARAVRDIQPQEELFESYDLCIDCGDDARWWGTIELLRDFGFVEPFTQRWVWPEHGVWFEVQQDKKTGETRIWVSSKGRRPIPSSRAPTNRKSRAGAARHSQQ